METAVRPISLIGLLELISRESDVEARLRAGRRLKGPSFKRVIDHKDRRGFSDEPVRPDPGFDEFQHWVSGLQSHLESAVDSGDWIFKGLSARSGTFPPLEAGYIRHSQITLLLNTIGEYREIEITPARGPTVAERVQRVMGEVMLSDEDRALTKSEIYKSVMASLPSLPNSAGILDAAWKQLTKTDFADYRKAGKRRRAYLG